MSARRDAHAAYLSLTLREQGLPTDAAMPDTPLRRLIFDRWLPASLFALIATPNIILFADMFGDGSSALNLSRQALTSVFVVLMASLFLVRRDRIGPRSTLGPAVVAVAGTAALSLVGVFGSAHPSAALQAAGIAVGLVGLGIAIVSLAKLGRCFGLFPEARGLVTGGPYRWVRHPLYLGELLMGLGVLIPVVAFLPAAIWLAFVGLQLRRAANEESVLRTVFPESYSAYRARTKRVLPFIW